MSIQTLDFANVGEYTVSIVGTIPSTFSTAVSFVLKVVNSCLALLLTNNGPPGPQEYAISDSALSLTLPDMTLPNSLCLLQFSLTLSDGSAVDTSLITFQASTLDFSVSTSDDAKEGTYNLLLTCSLVNGVPAQTQTYSFVLTVLNRCTLSTITVNPIADVAYDISMAITVTLISLTWTQSLAAVCPPITYTLVNSKTGASANPAVFSISSANVAAAALDTQVICTLKL